MNFLWRTHPNSAKAARNVTRLVQPKQSALSEYPLTVGIQVCYTLLMGYFFLNMVGYLSRSFCWCLRSFTSSGCSFSHVSLKSYINIVILNAKQMTASMLSIIAMTILWVNAQVDVAPTIKAANTGNNIDHNSLAIPSMLHIIQYSLYI